MKRVATRTAGPSLAIAVILTVAGAAREASPESQTKPVGCYRLAYGAWMPAIDPSALANELPPPEIELVVRRRHEAPKRVIPEYRGNDVIGKPPWADWQTDTGTHIILRWSTGFGGVVLLLRLDGEGVFRGRAKHWVDDGSTHDADVTATRVDCPVGGERKPVAH